MTNTGRTREIITQIMDNLNYEEINGIPGKDLKEHDLDSLAGHVMDAMGAFEFLEEFVKQRI